MAGLGCTAPRNLAPITVGAAVRLPRPRIMMLKHHSVLVPAAGSATASCRRRELSVPHTPRQNRRPRQRHPWPSCRAAHRRRAARRRRVRARTSAADPSVICYDAATTRAEPDQVRTAVHRILEPKTAQTIMNGMQKWLLQERTEGKIEGKIEGRAEVLLRQLRRRFGDVPGDITHRVTTATIQDLDRWADRILDAQSLDSVFAAS